MRLEECKGFDTITFGAMVDIQHIEYNDNDNKLYKNYISSINIKTHCEYTWNLNEGMIERLKLLDYEQFFCSDTFDNDSWGLCAMPNGKKVEEKGNFALGLVLYKLPFGLKYIKVSYTLKCIESNVMWEDTKDYIINTKWTSWPNELFLTKQLDDYKALTFTVSLQIVQIVNNLYESIDRKEWHKFGFIVD